MNYKKDTHAYKTVNRQDAGKETSPAVSGGGVYTEKGTDDALRLPAGVDFNFFVNDKAKKLTTALYMVTSFLSDSEPIKWKLRGAAIDLMSDIANIRNVTTSETDNLFAGVAVMIDGIVSLLEVAAASKLISDMNFSILKREYLALKGFILSDTYTEEKAGRFIFPANFFESDPPQPKITTKDIYTPTAVKSNNEKDVRGAPGMSIKEKDNKLSDTIKDKVSLSEEGTAKISLPTKGVSRVSVFTKRATKEDRRAAILKLFKNKRGKELTIKDISGEISGCSEKTIQRELIALVSDGVIKKRGERRWSRYSLR